MDLRDARDLAQWHLEQLRLQYDMQICIVPDSRIDPDHPYQCRDLFATSPFFNALQKIKNEIICELEVADPRWLHLSIPGPSEILVLAREDEYARLQMRQWRCAEIFHFG